MGCRMNGHLLVITFMTNEIQQFSLTRRETFVSGVEDINYLSVISWFTDTVVNNYII